jgi:hypothetical protein
MDPQEKNWHQTAVRLVIERRCFSRKCHSSTTGEILSQKQRKKRNTLHKHYKRHCPVG